MNLTFQRDCVTWNQCIPTQNELRKKFVLMHFNYQALAVILKTFDMQGYSPKKRNLMFQAEIRRGIVLYWSYSMLK